MKPIIQILCFAGLIVTASMVLYAADSPVTRTSGTVIILDNDRTLAGEITRHGDKFKIRREVGELWIPSRKVKCLCKDWPEALKFMESRANLYDPDERLRLARWCHQNELHDEAIHQAKQASRMRPKHSRTKQYLRFLEHAKKVANRPPAVQPVKNQLPPPPSLDISADSLSMFTTKIQPILMNTCARCHANAQSDEFVIMRASGLGSNRQRMTQYNMAAAVRQIDFHNAELSPLLIKAVSRHGNATHAPIRSRKSTPYKLLRSWIDATIVNNPHLKEQGALASRKPINDSSVKTAIFQPAFKSGSIPFASQSSVPPQTQVPQPRPFHEAKNPPNLTPPREPGTLQVLPETLPSVTGNKQSNIAGQSINTPPAKFPIANNKALPVSNNTQHQHQPARIQPASQERATGPRDEFDPAIFNEMFHGRSN